MTFTSTTSTSEVARAAALPDGPSRGRESTRSADEASGGAASDRVPIALVVGCARSGTSILGELLAAHPSVAYVFEAQRTWDQVGNARDQSHRLVAADATPEARAQIRAWFAEQLGSAALVVEKTPRNILRLPFVRAVFPEARVIHIVRDGRDVACSLLPGIGGAKWRHLKPPSWQRLLAEHTGVVRCALVWNEVLEIALADLSDMPHLQVRYEDLIAAPERVATAVLRYLDLPEHPSVAAFLRKIQNETADSYHAERQVKWYRDDHAVRVGRWRENMTPPEQRVVGELLAPLLRRLGYD